MGCFVIFLEVELIEIVNYVDFVVRVIGLDGIFFVEEYFDSMVDFVLFGVGQCNCYLFVFDGMFVFEKGIQFGGVVKQFFEVDFDSFVFFLNGNFDGGWDVGELYVDRF